MFFDDSTTDITYKSGIFDTGGILQAENIKIENNYSFY